MTWREEQRIDRSQRNCEMLRLRDQGLTLQAIGNRYGLTRQRIRVIVAGVRIRQRQQEDRS